MALAIKLTFSEHIRSLPLFLSTEVKSQQDENITDMLSILCWVPVGMVLWT